MKPILLLLLIPSLVFGQLSSQARRTLGVNGLSRMNLAADTTETPAPSQVVFDSVWSKASPENAARDTVPVNIPTVTNGLLIAFIPIKEGSNTNSADSVKLGTSKFTFVDSTKNQYTEENLWVYALVNPPAGAGNVIAYYNTGVRAPLMFVSLYHGANQGGGSNTFGARAKAYGSSTTPSVGVSSSSTTELVYSGVWVNATTDTYTAGAGVTELKTDISTVLNPYVSGSVVGAAGASGTVTVAGTLSGGTRWIAIGMAIKP